jgi:succinate dehydrogenase/fumarate reductase-like Fe-S protein
MLHLNDSVDGSSNCINVIEITAECGYLKAAKTKLVGPNFMKSVSSALKEPLAPAGVACRFL